MVTLTPERPPRPEVAVSVIMIFRDAGDFIAEAIESVRAQTFTDWELLLVDDGSTDAAAGIAAEHARRWPDRVRLLSHPGGENRGMSASRNLGIAAAQGRYVAFLDADDVYLPDRLRRHVEILERMADVDMVQSELVHWYSWQSPSLRSNEDYVRPFLRADDHVLEPPDGLLLALAVPLYSAGICNITVRRDKLLALGGFEPAFRAAFEDQVVLAKLYLNGKTYVLQAHLARYRRHPGSWTRQAKENAAVAASAEAARRAYHAWLVEYVDRCILRDVVLDELMHPLRNQAGRQVRQVEATRRMSPAESLMRLALRILPRRMLRAARRWNRAREFSEARGQYAGLCGRLRRAGRVDAAGVVGHPVPVPAGDGPCVSVIMIFRDAERFMDEAVQSVYAQTFTDWELLLVDDGSSDGSSVLARRYAAADPGRVRYLEHAGHAHRGTGPSRNLGLASATGAYAAFLDADDVYLPDRLARHLATFGRHPRARLAISREIYWRGWSAEDSGCPGGTDDIVGPMAQYDAPIEPPTMLRTALERRGAAMPGMCSVTFDRRLALDLGAIPEHFTSQYEDQALIAKLMLAGVAVVLEEPLVRYRQHAASLTHRLAKSGDYRPGRPHAALFEYLRWLRDYAAERAPQFPELDRVLHRRLWPTRHPALSSAFESARSVYRVSRGRAQP
jgi:glycosyltransferase involved in cell wall biosynthesis